MSGKDSTPFDGTRLIRQAEFPATIVVKERHEEILDNPVGFYTMIGSVVLATVLFDRRYDDGLNWVLLLPFETLRFATKEEALQVIRDRLGAIGLECPSGDPFEAQ